MKWFSSKLSQNINIQRPIRIQILTDTGARVIVKSRFTLTAKAARQIDAYGIRLFTWRITPVTFIHIESAVRPCPPRLTFTS